MYNLLFFILVFFIYISGSLNLYSLAKDDELSRFEFKRNRHGSLKKSASLESYKYPFVITTWAFTGATQAGIKIFLFH